MNDVLTYAELTALITSVPNLHKPCESYLKDNFEVICTSPDGSAVCYSCGYVVYRTISGYSIFPLSKCKKYTYESNCNSNVIISEEQIAGMNWYFPVIAYGASRVEYNRERWERKHRCPLDDNTDIADVGCPHYDEYYDGSIESMYGCLTDRQKEILLMNVIYGYTQAEIADILNLTLSTVSRTVKYAKDKMRKFVGNYKL